MNNGNPQQQTPRKIRLVTAWRVQSVTQRCLRDPGDSVTALVPTSGTHRAGRERGRGCQRALPGAPGRSVPGGSSLGAQLLQQPGLSALPARSLRQQPGGRTRPLTALSSRLQRPGRRKFPRPARAGARRFLKPDVTPSGPSGDPPRMRPAPLTVAG